MTNSERAAQLLGEAEVIFSEAEGAFQKEKWNLCIRRCQEVVELTLKSLLIQMGKDYPKVHDVAPLVASILREKKLAPAGEFLDWLLEFSAHLASRRAPAFYFEQEYSRADAEEAVAGTHKLFDFVRDFFRANG